MHRANTPPPVPRTRRTEGTRVRGRAERVVAAVHAATHEELGRVGYGALRVEDVAARSGVNKTTIYRRWPTKAELVAASLRAANEEQEQPDTGTLRGDLLVVVMRTVRTCKTPTGRGIVRMLQTERADPDVEALSRSLRDQRWQRNRALVERGITRGELPADVNPELLLDLILGGIYARLIHRGEDIREDYAAAAIDTVLAGACAGSARLQNEPQQKEPREDDMTIQSNETRAQREGNEDTRGTTKEAPVLGSVVLDRSDPDFLARSPEIYEEARAKGPVVRARHYPFPRDEEERKSIMAGERPIGEVLFVSHYEEAAGALLDDRLASDPFARMTPEQRAHVPPVPEELRPIAYSLLMLDPPDHTRLRKLVQPSFNARAMEALRPRIQRLTDDLLDKAEQEAAARGESAPERRMDLVKAFAYPLPVTVISDMLGIPEEDRETVSRLGELRIDNRDPVVMQETRKMLVAFSHYLVDLFERKRRAPGDDMISQMIHAQEDGDKLNDKELLSMVFLLYLAGHVTTVNLIGNGVVALLTHPEQLARFKADPVLAKGVVEETLRYWGPVDYLGAVRTAREDLEIAGVSIPKGGQVMIGLGSANRDPEQFADPHAYDIGREGAHRHIAFGKGIHLCLGAPLARIEGQIAFETLFRRYPDLRLAVPAETLRWGGAAGLRGFRELPVLF
ncbi:cytochrome P450 [Polyangium sorediatum]|uniref:Cytochrome P450 n=1 Tax=Polyangium sorediatum TaxID=889274 RepID=A0ABT6NK81_9BACT|nr:cytochrome P450 [Polyangium sorediatum]MDI1428716.1 cytochrome P450 [Polyangium sorediatum]